MPVGSALEGAELVDMATRQDAMLPTLAPTTGSRVKLLTDEGEVLPDMLDAVRGAKHQIDFAMFSLQDTGAGTQMVDALIDRAKHGVDVHVTLDQIGSSVIPFTKGPRMVDRLTDAGVNVAINDRVSSKGLKPVDHRKLLVVDGETAYTGGMNFSGKFGKWHDVMVRVDGPAAAQFSAHFLDRWVDMAGDASAGQKTLGMRGPAAAGTTAPTDANAVADAGKGVAFLVNHPGREMQASDHILDNLSKATERAWILTPTLSDPAVVTALKEAASRGVDTRVAVSGPEGWIGTRALRLVGATFYRELVDAGVKIYEQPGMSHAKVSLIDDIASAGSLNMTRRAMLWDHELQLASDDPAFVKQVDDLFTTDFAKSTLITSEQANSFGYRAGELLRKATGLKW